MRDFFFQVIYVDALKVQMKIWSSEMDTRKLPGGEEMVGREIIRVGVASLLLGIVLTWARYKKNKRIKNNSIERSNYIKKRYVYLRQIGFSLEKIEGVFGISPKLIKKAERYLFWEDRLMIFYMEGDLLWYMILGLVIYLWLLIITNILNYYFEFRYTEKIFCLYALVVVVSIVIGNKLYFYFRKRSEDLCRVIENIYRHDLSR